MHEIIEFLDNLGIQHDTSRTTINRKDVREKLKTRAILNTSKVSEEDRKRAVTFLNKNGYSTLSDCITDVSVNAFNKYGAGKLLNDIKLNNIGKKELSYITLPGIIISAVLNHLYTPWYDFEDLLPDTTEVFYEVLRSDVNLDRLSQKLRNKTHEMYINKMIKEITKEPDLEFDDSLIGVSNIESDFLRNETIMAVRAVYEDALTQREKHVIDVLYDMSGIFNCHVTLNMACQMLASIGCGRLGNTKLLPSPEAVRRIEEKALRRMRHPVYSRNLKYYINFDADSNILFHGCRTEEGLKVIQSPI